ncbi:PadR family transcriptional regulator [candidate division KSB1 bacterium]
MALLTRSEELILLAVYKLRGDAYCVSIRKMLTRITGEKWSLGSIYMPIERMLRNGLLKSYMSESTPERGGRQKRIYQLTREGEIALTRIHSIQDKMWSDVTNLSPECES